MLMAVSMDAAFPSAGPPPPAGTDPLTRFRVVQTLPPHINAPAAVLQKRCPVIASVQTLRRNIATMCSVSARAARSAVWVIAAALRRSNAKWPPPRWRGGKSAEQMLGCHFCPSASACDEAAAVSTLASSQHVSQHVSEQSAR